MVSPTAIALCHVWLDGHILVPQWFCPCGQYYHQKLFKNNHVAVPVKVARQQTTPKPSETLELSGTLRNLLEVASGTYTCTYRNPPEPSRSCLRNRHQHTPELAGTCLRNLHQHTPELSGTFWNLPPEPAPATRTGTQSLSWLKTPLAYAVGEKDSPPRCYHKRPYLVHIFLHVLELTPNIPPNNS